MPSTILNNDGMSFGFQVAVACLTFVFVFFPGMQRAEQVNRNRLRKYDVILLSYLKRDLRKVKSVRKIFCFFGYFSESASRFAAAR